MNQLEIPSYSESSMLEMKVWLKNTCSQWETVCDYWKQTLTLRLPQFQNDSTKTLSALLEEWPRFNDADGYQLVCIF